MSDSIDFANNPFAALAQKLSAKNEADTKVVRESAHTREKRQQPKPLRHREQNRLKPHGEQGRAHAQDADDSQLFLQAVQQVRPSSAQGKSAERATGWRMEEAVELPNMSKAAKKRKDASDQSSVAPSTGTAPTPPHKRIQGIEGTRGAGGTHGGLKRGINAVHAMTDIALGNDAVSADEQAFFRAMREVQPLSGKGRDVVPEVEPAVSPEQAAHSLQDFLDGKLEFALALTGEYLEGYVVGLDDITMNKLRAGQYSPEAHLDLHGLNAMQAYQALVGFFRSTWYKGLRTVLVVPGRGRNSHDGIGVLRDKLQSWLTQEPFKRVVLAFCTARPVDGGPGSVYVLLRKYRKKGKIYWERTPVDPDLF